MVRDDHSAMLTVSRLSLPVNARVHVLPSIVGYIENLPS